MRPPRRLPPLAAALAALVASSCAWDDEADIDGPAGGLLALGAFVPFDVRDACRGGGGKGNVCSSEEVVSIDSLTVEDPTIVELLDGAQVPAGLLPPGAKRALRGVRAGKTTVHVRATFDDGSVREARAAITVAAPTKVEVEPACHARAEAKHLVPAGADVTFALRLRAGDDLLDGVLEAPIDETLVERLPPRSRSGMEYRWKAPPGGGKLPVRSRLDRKLAFTFDAYLPARVGRVEASTARSTPLSLAPGEALPLDVYVKVDGKRPCHSAPVAARTERPDVCNGPEGAATWRSEGPEGTGLPFHAVKEGTCVLSLGAAGAPFKNRASFPFYVPNQAHKGRRVLAQEPCAPGAPRECTFDRAGLVACVDGRWTFDRACGAKLCDYVDGGRPGCAAPGPCAVCR